MKWKKLGRVFRPSARYPWMQSHAAVPVAEHLRGDRFRVYFSCRDRKNRSSVGFVEFDIRQPQKILALSPRPVLSPGAAGHFDDSGTVAACLCPARNGNRLYYLAWNLSVTVPWRNSIGLAVAPHGSARYRKSSAAPVLDRHEADPFSLSYPWVLREGDAFKMWYGSVLKWGPGRKDMTHAIKYAVSSDGVSWRRTGKIAIPLRPGETIVSRPCVTKAGGTYKMWYSRRTTKYRIGYAESRNGISWVRMDRRAGIDVSVRGWDSEMIEYPHVFEHRGRRYMLYNGNGYGKTGFGLAVLEKG